MPGSKLDTVYYAHSFACRAEALESSTMQPVLEELRSAEFRAVINALPGYDAMASGQVMTLAEAFPFALRQP